MTRLWDVSTGALVRLVHGPGRPGVRAGLLERRRPPHAAHRRPRRHDDRPGTCRDRDASASRSMPERAPTVPAQTRRAPSRTSRSARTDACWPRTTSTGSRSSTPRRTPRCVRSSAAVPNGSFDVAWSPDGTRLAVTGSGAEMVDLYDTATWQLVSPDGGPLAGPFADRPASSDEIDPNDPTETGRRLNVASAVAFSPDSARVVAGADDGTVWTWDARTGAPVGAPAAARRAGPSCGDSTGSRTRWLSLTVPLGAVAASRSTAPASRRRATP